MYKQEVTWQDQDPRHVEASPGMMLWAVSTWPRHQILSWPFVNTVPHLTGRCRSPIHRAAWTWRGRDWLALPLPWAPGSPAAPCARAQHMSPPPHGTAQQDQKPYA